MTEPFTEKQIETYSLALLKWAYGKTGSHSAAEDLVQEVWMQLYHSMRNGPDVTSRRRPLSERTCRFSHESVLFQMYLLLWNRPSN